MNNKIREFSGLFGRQDGLAQIPLMIGLLLMAVAIPAVTMLSQQSQDNRNRAAGGASCVDAPSCSRVNMDSANSALCSPACTGGTMCC